MRRVSITVALVILVVTFLLSFVTADLTSARFITPNGTTINMTYDENTTSYADASLSNENLFLEVCATLSADLADKYARLEYKVKNATIDITILAPQLEPINGSTCAVVDADLSRGKALYPGLLSVALSDDANFSSVTRIDINQTDGWLEGNYTLTVVDLGSVLNVTIANITDDEGKIISFNRTFITIGVVNSSNSVEQAAIISPDDSVILPDVGEPFRFLVNRLPIGGAAVAAPNVTPTPSPAPSTGGGGGGGSAGAGVSAPSLAPVVDATAPFTVRPAELNFDLGFKEAREEVLIIQSNRATSQEITLTIGEIGDLITLSEYTITLEPFETREITVFAVSERDPGFYVGSIAVASSDHRVVVPTVVEISSQEVLFDATLFIEEKFRQVAPGEVLPVHVTLFNVGSPRKVDVLINYRILDLDGTLISSESETIAVEGQKDYDKEFFIPSGTEYGSFVIGLEVIYVDSVATATSVFQVVPRGLDLLAKRNRFLYIVGVIFSVMLLMSLLYLADSNRKLRQIRETSEVQKRNEEFTKDK